MSYNFDKMASFHVKFLLQSVAVDIKTDRSIHGQQNCLHHRWRKKSQDFTLIFDTI